MGVWRWDSEAIFFLLSFVRIFHGDGTVRHFFLFVFCQYEEGSVEMGQCGNFFCCLFVIIRKLSLLSKKIYHMISVLNNINHHRYHL